MPGHYLAATHDPIAIGLDFIESFLGHWTEFSYDRNEGLGELLHPFLAVLLGVSRDVDSFYHPPLSE